MMVPTATWPIFGRQLARDFYSYVTRVTTTRSMALRTIFIGASDPSRAAIHVAYTRTVGSSMPAAIEGVGVFDLRETTASSQVTIICDRASVRSDFDRPETNHS